MKITVTKHSKDGLAAVTLADWTSKNATMEDAKDMADELLDRAGAVLNTRYKAMKAKEKAKAARRAGRVR